MEQLTKLLLYIPGIFVFLAGSGQVRRLLSMKKFGFSVDAAVKSCTHVVKKDKAGRETFNYYNVLVEYRNPQTGNTDHTMVKSPTEYAQAQQVTLYIDRHGKKTALVEKQETSPFYPWMIMVGGALMILLVLFQNQDRKIAAMCCLSLLLFGTGAAMLTDFLSLKRSNLQELNAEVIDVYERQISKETKIIKGAKFTYYPIVRYQIDGKEAIRRCIVNSEKKTAFKPGSSMTLYLNPETKAVTERHAKTSAAVIGSFLLIAGVIAIAGILQALFAA